MLWRNTLDLHPPFSMMGLFLGRIAFLILAAQLIPAPPPGQAQTRQCKDNVRVSIESQLRLASCHAEKNQWWLAEQEVAAYRQLHPDSIDAAVLQAEVLLELHLPSDANEVVSRMSAAHPHSIALETFQARLSERLGDRELAESLFVLCTRAAPKNPQVWINLGDFYLQTDGQKAIPAYRQAVANQQNSASAHAGLATALALIRDHPQASAEFQKALELNRLSTSPDPKVELQYAEFLRETENCEESVKYYSVAIKEDPLFLDAKEGRAINYMKMGKWDLAEKDLNDLLKDQNRRISTLTRLLKVYQHQGNDEKARECAEEIESLSNAELAAKNLGNQIADKLRGARILEQSNKHSEAAEAYTRLLLDHPEVDAAWYGLGIAHFQLGVFDESESDFRNFLRSNPDSAKGHLYLGKVLLQKKAYQESRSECRLAKGIDPLLLDARLGVAASYMKESNFQEAISELRKASKLPEFRLEVHLMLAEAYHRVREEKEALTEVDQVLHREPANAKALRMKCALLHSC